MKKGGEAWLPLWGDFVSFYNTSEARRMLCVFKVRPSPYLDIIANQSPGKELDQLKISWISIVSQLKIGFSCD